jgi:hypothetical protein
MLDELAPIEDNILATQYGSIKDARYVSNLQSGSSAALVAPRTGTVVIFIH